VQIPIDDYTFHAAMKRGKLVSRPNEMVYVQAIDLSQDAEGSQFSFKMSVVESSLLEQKYPEYEDGLLGQWAINGTTGLLSFKGPFLSKHYEEIVAFLSDVKSNTLLRSRYEASLSNK